MKINKPDFLIYATIIFFILMVLSLQYQEGTLFLGLAFITTFLTAIYFNKNR